MNIIEFYKYKEYCPFCNSKMELFADFLFTNINIYTADLINISYKYNGNKFIKLPLKEKIKDFDETKLINTFSINKIIFPKLGLTRLNNKFSIIDYGFVCSCPSKNHSYRYTSNQIYNRHTINDIELIMENIKANDLIILNRFKKQIHTKTTIYVSGKSDYNFPPIPIEKWQLSNLKSQIDKYLILK